MRSRMKAVVAMVVVVVAVSATAAASASAAEWYVGGSALTGSASLASLTKTHENILWESVLPTIKCDGVEVKSGDILAPSGGQIEHLLFTSCDNVSGECSIKNETIESKPLKLEAALGAKSPEDTVALKPVTGSVFAEYTNMGPKCSLGVIKLMGKAMLVLPKGREELAEQELTLTTKKNELIGWGGGSVILSGKVLAKLVSGKGWSFH